MDALASVYSFIGLDKTKFKFTPANFWADVGNQRKFFEDWAKEKGLDPNVPTDAWYKVKSVDVKTSRGGQPVLGYYGRSLSSALVNLFPNAGFKVDKFKRRNVLRQ